MRANLITQSESKRVEVYFSHAIEHGVGFGQLWVDGRFHIEFTAAGLRELAEEATELANGL